MPPCRPTPPRCVALFLALTATMAATGSAAAQSLPPDRDDGYLPVAGGDPGDAARSLLRPEPATPAPPAPPPPAATPGQRLLDERTRRDRVVEGLATWLVARRPDVLVARFGEPVAAEGSRVAIPLELAVDPDAYARFAAEAAQRIAAFVGDPGVEVDMPIQAEALAADRLLFGPPTIAAADGSVREYAGPMTVFVCLSVAAKPASGSWPASATPVARYEARWRVFDVPSEISAGLAEQVARHPLYVRPLACDAGGEAVPTAYPGGGSERGTDPVFAVEGLLQSPGPEFLVVWPLLMDRQNVEGEAEAPGRTAWRRTSRPAIADEDLASFARLRCRYGTFCRSGALGTPCRAGHAEGTTPSP